MHSLHLLIYSSDTEWETQSPNSHAPWIRFSPDHHWISLEMISPCVVPGTNSPFGRSVCLAQTYPWPNCLRGKCRRPLDRSVQGRTDRGQKVEIHARIASYFLISPLKYAFKVSQITLKLPSSSTLKYLSYSLLITFLALYRTIETTPQMDNFWNYFV